MEHGLCSFAKCGCLQIHEGNLSYVNAYKVTESCYIFIFLNSKLLSIFTSIVVRFFKWELMRKKHQSVISLVSGIVRVWLGK